MPAHALLWFHVVPRSLSFIPAAPHPRRCGLVDIGFAGGAQFMTTLWRNARLATLAGAGWGLVERGALLVEGETLSWVGADGRTAARPGIAASMTWAARSSPRAWSTATPTWSMAASVRANSRCGWRARATKRSRAPAAASDRPWLPRVQPATRTSTPRRQARALALMAEGVTTLEMKSGYGLSAEHEARCLRVARRLGRELPLSVQTTCLSAHALPPEFEGRADDYIDAVCAWLPALQAEGLVDAVDAFCDRIAFSPAQTRRVFEAARALGLPVKLHAEQLSDQGGAALAAEFGALSCDHLEYLSEAGVARWPRAGTGAVLLPGAYYFLRETKLPPIDALRTAGVPIAHCHGPQSGIVADAVAPADAQHGLHAVSPDPRRGLARHDRERRARAWPSRPRRARRRARAPTSWSGRTSTRTSWPTGSASAPRRGS